jgi:hypothetical protein
MNPRMNRALVSLIIVTLLAIYIGPTVGQVDTTIRVFDKNRSPAQGASINIFQGEKIVNQGYSDGQGTFRALLDPNINYVINVTLLNQFGRWEGQPSGRISIYLIEK